ncbi:MAG TPA: hypothetical protein ENJ89_07020 [Caldithrix abyssi]|uniref:DUF5683 domain-containing protein n=1 Tax=Caldithrix abyssi TaxID=187145 RepID=A0A7V5UF57_CALAY|nr:hypothetical protein [Caldithrix abyssi]
MRSILVFLLLAAVVSGQTLPAPDSTGISFNSQKFSLMEQARQMGGRKAAVEFEKKSGVKAALLSALIPGGGQAYVGSYWKAALFAGLEIAFWSANVIYNNKGDSEDARMRQFGDQHWSEQRYWSYIYQQAREWPPDAPKVEVDANGIILDAYYTDELIEYLRGVEAEVGTHTLPRTKTQQYYEMIYKYLHQFGAGWDDVPDLFYYNDIANIHNLTPNISKYRDMRDRSNGYYDVANTMVMLVLANHLTSALEAAWSSKQYNKKYHLSLNAHRQFAGSQWVNLYGLNVQW